ncbi:hypothetical protein ACTA71_005339 [Dictyostelium dimigraforme]
MHGHLKVSTNFNSNYNNNNNNPQIDNIKDTNQQNQFGNNGCRSPLGPSGSQSVNNSNNSNIGNSKQKRGWDDMFVDLSPTKPIYIHFEKPPTPHIKFTPSLLDFEKEFSTGRSS